MNAGDIERLALGVMAAHGCHTVILYGSHARGDASEHSDVDLVLVREAGPGLRDARLVDGTYLDAFVYPESAFEPLEPPMLRILGGVVLQESDGFGTKLLERLRAKHELGPTALPEDERRALIVWSQKMLARLRNGDGIEVEYRRMKLLLQAPADYFALRGTWYAGEKEAFAWLREHDAATYALLERASHPGASSEHLAALVLAVYGTA